MFTFTVDRGRATRGLLALFTLSLVLVLAFAPAAAQDAGAIVSAGMSNEGIPTLVGPDGRTLYWFAHDHEGESTCYDQCAEEWPPLTVDEGADLSAGEGVSGQLATVAREDGSMQVTYNGWPLYYYHEDEAPGDANGQGEHDVWFAAAPATLMLGGNDGIGEFLVGPGGMTLYVFLEDEVSEEGSESYCFQECAVAWPPLIVPEGVQPMAGAGVPGELGTIPRDDGSLHVTYNGWPLYFFKMDEKPGDATGNALKDVWFVALPEETYETQLSVGVELVAEGLAAPVAFVSANDGSGRMFIADQAGMIRVLSADGELLEEPFLDLTGQIVPLREDYDERGVLGLAFHPDYANNGRFFVYYTAPLSENGPEGWDHSNVVAEFRVSPDNPDVADLATQKLILRIDQPQFNHNAGQIAFGPDGYLYIPIGDGGGGNDNEMGHTPDIGNAQDTSNLHGSILRIDVDNGDPYAIPADNPFINDDAVLDEIFAYGLRNPFSLSFDRGGNGDLFVADAGQELYEEVNIVTAGGNYGWNIKEGTHCFDPENPEQPPADCPDTAPNGAPLVDPIIEYDHRYGVVVVGGGVYRGEAIPDLNGYYIFGSYALSQTADTGLLFAAQPSDDGGLWDFQELQIAGSEAGHLGARVLSFGMDDAGEMYVLTTENSAPAGDTGKVWRLTPAS
jgi:predicted lipoprotein with Yx(FWY)xxD motif